jgi:hypothetical protein
MAECCSQNRRLARRVLTIQETNKAPNVKKPIPRQT